MTLILLSSLHLHNGKRGVTVIQVLIVKALYPAVCVFLLNTLHLNWEIITQHIKVDCLKRTSSLCEILFFGALIQESNMYMCPTLSISPIDFRSYSIKWCRFYIAYWLVTAVGLVMCPSLGTRLRTSPN